MGTIVTSGVGSGLDTVGLVKKLVEAEGAPKTVQLNQQEAKVQAKLSALGTLRSALASFRDTVTVLTDAAKFQGRQVALSSQTHLSATATTAAAPGSYAVEVQQLASAHKLQSGSFASASTTVGTGTLTIATGGQNYTVAIGTSNNTLAGIAAAINNSSAGTKVVAAVVSGASSARLTITARSTGAANALTITQSGGDGGLAGLVYPPSGSGLAQLQAANDARVLIDSVLATSSTNAITGAIAGVDLTLSAVNTAGQTTGLTIGFDQVAARKSIDNFVKAYNTLIDALRNATSYNAETRQAAPLFGDGGVRNLSEQLRRELSGSVADLGGSFDTLAGLGISAQLDGKLVVDAAAVNTAFASNFDLVGEFFAADDKGLAVKLDVLLGRYLATEGVLESRTASLKSSIELINEQREALTARLTALQTRYTKQFNALDGLLAKLQGTSNFLNQQLSQLPGSAPRRN